jgi:hypothetical protein
MNQLQKSALACAIVAMALASAVPASADCRGYVCNVVKSVAPAWGPPLELGDDYLKEMKSRGSGDNVLNQATTGKTFDHPVGKPYYTPQPQSSPQSDQQYPQPQYQQQDQQQYQQVFVPTQRGSRCLMPGGAWQVAQKEDFVGAPCASIAYMGIEGRPTLVYGRIVQ